MPRFLATAVLAAACLPAGASAESLRCNGQSTGPGESKLSVLRKCGEPAMKDTFCKPVEAVLPGYPYPVVLPRHVAPCEWVDDWLYDRGEGNLYATVRFSRGTVESIRYEGRPR